VVFGFPPIGFENITFGLGRKKAIGFLKEGQRVPAGISRMRPDPTRIQTKYLNNPAGNITPTIGIIVEL
jgi:hypothetical protein